MYHECVQCNRIGITCDGPNFLALPSSELIKWLKARKKYLGWTNSKLAEESNTPKGTVDRILAGEHLDFKFETVRPMIRAMVGGKFDGNPCPTPDGEYQPTEDISKYADKITALQEENNELKNRLLAADPQHKEEIAKAKAEEHEKVVYLKEAIERKNKVIAILAVLLFVAVAMIFIALIVDVMNPDKGFFWLGQFFKQNAVPHIGSIQ